MFNSLILLVMSAVPPGKHLNVGVTYDYWFGYYKLNHLLHNLPQYNTFLHYNYPYTSTTHITYMFVVIV